MLIDLSLPLEKRQPENMEQRETDLFRFGHYGTHLDRLLNRSVSIDYFKSRALLFDISAFSRQRPVLDSDLAFELVQEGDFILFHTGAILRNAYASKEYLNEYIEFSWEVLHAFLKRKVHFIGLDARGIRRNEEHRKADILCEESGTFVIENLANTEKLPVCQSFTIYTAWFDTGGTGLPCKVVAEVN
jgi:kynurenine formamidase